jgi:hypothetical protein
MASWKERAKPVAEVATGSSWKQRAVPVTAPPSPPTLGVPEAIEGATAAPQAGGYAGVTPKDIYNFATSIGENIPVLGPAAVAGGERFGALLKYLTDEGVSYDDALKAIQQQNEARRAEKIEESPVAAGVAAPLAAAAMIPAPFAAAEGVAGAAGRIAADAGMAAADDLARGDLQDAPKDAGLVGGIQAAIESVPMIKRTGLNRALKAAFGQQKKAFVETAKTAGKLEATGEALLKADEAGPAVVRFGSTAEDIAPRAEAKRQFFGKKIEDVGKKIDEILPATVSGQAIAAKIQQQLDGIAVNKETETIRQRLQEHIDEFSQMGDISFADAQKHKDSFRFKKGEPTAHVLPQDVRNGVKMAIGDTMEETVANVAAANGMPELAEQYAKYKKAYGIYKPVAKFSQDRALGDMANRILSPSDMYVAGTLSGGAFLGSMLSGGDIQSSGGASTTAALVGGAVSNIARRRGSAAAAVTAKFVGDLLEMQPALFGRFRSQLSAAKAKGATSLIMTHEALLQSPEYRSMMGVMSGELSKEDGDVAMISDPALIGTYKQSLSESDSLSNIEKAKKINELNKTGFYSIDLRPYKDQFNEMVKEPEPVQPKTLDEIKGAMEKASH